MVGEKNRRRRREQQKAAARRSSARGSRVAATGAFSGCGAGSGELASIGAWKASNSHGKRRHGAHGPHFLHLLPDPSGVSSANELYNVRQLLWDWKLYPSTFGEVSLLAEARSMRGWETTMM